MMYHRIFGLRGCSAATVPVAAPSAPFPFSVVCSLVSSIRMRTAALSFLSTPGALQLAMREVLQYPVNTVADDVINRPKIRAKQEHRNHDDHRCRSNFLHGRCGDLLGLRAHIVVERLNALRPR